MIVKNKNHFPHYESPTANQKIYTQCIKKKKTINNGQYRYTPSSNVLLHILINMKLNFLSYCTQLNLKVIQIQQKFKEKYRKSRTETLLEETKNHLTDWFTMLQ